MRPESGSLALLLLAACSSTFTADNTRRFVCDESAAACVQSGIDPTCEATYQSYHDNVVCELSSSQGAGVCGSYAIGAIATGGEIQWTIFDRDSGEFVAILSLPPSGERRCEVGPSDLDLGCDPTQIAWEFDCPIHEDGGGPIADAMTGSSDAAMTMPDAPPPPDAPPGD